MKGYVREGRRTAFVATFFLGLGAFVVTSSQACSVDWTIQTMDGRVAETGEGGKPSITASEDATAENADASDADAQLADVKPEPDAEIVMDAGEKIEAGGCQSGCDCDLDGFESKLCDAGNTGDSGKSKVDCDDLDERAHPDQAYFLSASQVFPTNGDWNCDGTVETFYAANVSCGGLLASNCSSIRGFTGAPKCGESGDFVTCTPTLLGLACGEGKHEIRTQACR